MRESGKVLIHSALARRFPIRIERFERILAHNGLPYARVDASDAGIWKDIEAARAYIHYFVHRESEKQAAGSVLPVVENVYGIPVFPNYATRWHYDDKISQQYLLQARGFPFAPGAVFWDREAALGWLAGAELPMVFKLKAGAGSRNVVLIDSREQARRLIDEMFAPEGVESEYLPDTGNLSRIRNLFGLYRLRQRLALRRGRIHYQDIRPYWQRQRDYVMFQKFLPGNQFDTRVTVVGGRAFVYRRWNRPGDFRASGSGRLDYDQQPVDRRCIALAHEISAMYGFQSMAYDFMFDEAGQPQIGEISYTYIDEYVYNCPGFYDSELRWTEGHYWPQLCILQDLLQMPDMSQPDAEAMR